MEDEHPEDDGSEQIDLERTIEIYEQLEQVIESLLAYSEQFRELGYNIGIIVHTYDPLLKEASYVGDVTGDRYAVLGCLHEWMNNT